MLLGLGYYSVAWVLLLPFFFFFDNSGYSRHSL
jgi:hypothetical protein